ncbi:hypothetical protein SteCoe_36427 [Stentor coeruleus]|uniref:Uncharacterized protein n=1 Tax=Stentor coeruleus TaxID=5963 RepID=A0A1R2AQ46_9CILI|nr:hypothetical protein SteCoe_36427 [Stentor coeruleus]
MILTKFSFYFLALALGNQMKIQTYDNCKISICEAEKVEIDSDGNFWPKYCYQCPNGEEEVIFLREYTPNGWGYVTTKDSLYQGRLILNVLPCDDEEVDSMGNRWETWCFDTGDVVSFEKLGKNNWEYKKDYDGGYGRLQFRRILDNSLLKIYKKPLEVKEDIQDSNESNQENIENQSITNNLNTTDTADETKNSPDEETKAETEDTKSESINKYKQNTIKNENLKLETPENQEEFNIKDEFSVEIVKSFTDNSDLSIKHDDLIETSNDFCEPENSKIDANLSQKQLSPITEIKTNSKEPDKKNNSQQSIVNKNPIHTQSSSKNGQILPEPFLVSDSSTLLNTLENSKEKTLKSVNKQEELSTKDNQETNQKSEMNKNNHKDIEKNVEENSQSVLQEEIIIPYIEKVPKDRLEFDDSLDKKDLQDKITEKKNEVQKILENWLASEEKNNDLIENNDTTLKDDNNSSESFEGKESEDDNKLKPCSEIEGDKSGRYYYVDYDEKGKRIDYVKDANGNYIFDTNKQQRVPGGFLSLEPVVKDNNTPCSVYDFRGKLIEFEPDMYIKNLFWQIVYENGIRVKFMKARLSSEKLGGNYLIDPNTGYRYRSFI